MSDLPLAGATNIKYITLSSSTETIPPTTLKATSKEISKAFIEEAMEITKPIVPIILNT